MKITPRRIRPVCLRSWPLMSLPSFNASPPWRHSFVVLLSLSALIACSSDKDDVSEETNSSPTEEDPTPGDGTDDALASCEFGNDETKCNGAADRACAPTLVSTETECNRDAECEEGALCFESSNSNASEGLCMKVEPLCVFRCGGDFDCEGEAKCNPASGRCEAAVELGARFGEACGSGADECAGHCVQVDDDRWECEEQCRVGAASGCGEAVLEDSNAACAYFAFDLDDIDVEQGAGDAGVCARLCDCDGDCPGDQLCLADGFNGYRGVCTGGLEPEDSLGACAADGMGGAGGSDGR